MNSNLDTLYDDLYALCAQNDAFYFVDQMDANGDAYRVFTYRLASFTDFKNRNAIECRGHTFRADGDGWVLASLPMAKFWNLGEHIGWGTEMDFNAMAMVMDKLDGSLISTVTDAHTGWFLKSKTSFKSIQVQEATDLIHTDEYTMLRMGLSHANTHGYTVNMEYISPSNQIVIGYSKPMLKVLNARHKVTGKYVPREYLVATFGEDFVVNVHDIPVDGAVFLKEVENMKGIEGFVIQLSDGLMFKIKTDAYCILHHLKDSVNNPKRLWEACLMETSDDMRALFKDDPISIQKILDMEVKASNTYNYAHKKVSDFYETNKHLDRKSYAILGQSELLKENLFSLAMNLYIGRDMNLKEFLIKNYKQFGITDEEIIEVAE